MYTILATALALAGAAVAAPAVATTDFGLHAYTADLALQDWAVVNAHVAAGTNAIQIQRPSVYQADPAYLNGTELLFDLPGAQYPYGVVIPEVPAGTVGQVFSKPGDSVTGFAVANETLLYNGSADGFWACGVYGTFNLFYGVNPDPANLPNTDCLAITLRAY
ncbi:hypothetical protein SLS62_005614 [Diatrype stigma]|uniref:DUF7907 domain-containing protein n=1 Tax=Diatrype stigma TaxID=117547 RepID=A0AAN9USG5_9PEZI